MQIWQFANSPRLHRSKAFTKSLGVSPKRRSQSRKVHRRIRPTRLWELAFMSEVDAVSAISEHAKLQVGNQRNQTAADTAGFSRR